MSAASCSGATSTKAKFLLATDGETVGPGTWSRRCHRLRRCRPAAPFRRLPDAGGHFHVKKIKNNPIGVKATGRLHKPYIELLRNDPDRATEERPHALNRFVARLIFCFFAEDTGIVRDDQFTTTITRMRHAGHGSGEEQWATPTTC